MPLSIDTTDVKVLGSIAVIIAGLLVVISGVWRGDVALITLGAGLLGAPGVAAAVTTQPPTEGAVDESES